MEWDRTLTSNKIKLDADNMTITGADGGSFRSAIGNYVHRLICYFLDFYSRKMLFFPNPSHGGQPKDWR